MVEAFEPTEATCGIPEVGRSSKPAIVISDVRVSARQRTVNFVKYFENYPLHFYRVWNGQNSVPRTPNLGPV